MKPHDPPARMPEESARAVTASGTPQRPAPPQKHGRKSSASARDARFYGTTGKYLFSSIAWMSQQVLEGRRKSSGLRPGNGLQLSLRASLHAQRRHRICHICFHCHSLYNTSRVGTSHWQPHVAADSRHPRHPEPGASETCVGCMRGAPAPSPADMRARRSVEAGFGASKAPIPAINSAPIASRLLGDRAVPPPTTRVSSPAPIPALPLRGPTGAILATKSAHTILDGRGPGLEALPRGRQTQVPGGSQDSRGVSPEKEG